MAVLKERAKGSQRGKKANYQSLRRLGSGIARVVSSRKKPRLVVVPPSSRLRAGKVMYYVKVKAPIHFPLLVFDKRKNAEGFVKLLKTSTTVADWKLNAVIIKREETPEGYHL